MAPALSTVYTDNRGGQTRPAGDKACRSASMTQLQSSAAVRVDLRYWLHPGLADSDSLTGLIESYPGTHAGLALALDRADHDTLELQGAYGRAEAYAVIATNDGQMLRVSDDPNCLDGEIDEEAAFGCVAPGGELSPADVLGLRELVWDGNNHVAFAPDRSLRFVDPDRRWERIGPVEIRWGVDGEAPDIRWNDGWDVADEYYSALGNQPWEHGDAELEAREAALDAAGIKYETVEVARSGEDRDVMIMVPTCELERAVAAMIAAE